MFVLIFVFFVVRICRFFLVCWFREGILLEWVGVRWYCNLLSMFWLRFRAGFGSFFFYVGDFIFGRFSGFICCRSEFLGSGDFSFFF